MTILTSLHGRIFGLDRFGNVETNKGYRNSNVVAASTGTNITNNGITTFASTAGGNTTFNLDAPVLGIEKTLVSIGASTSQIVSSTGAGAAIESTSTGTSTKFTFVGIGQSLTLIGLSTALWGVTGNVGAVAFSS